MDVSIVIVSFSTSRLLDECIVSIKEETHCAYEIIVVDNASTDDSCRMIKEKHPEAMLIENSENVGFARANNQGFALARGNYFFMLNSDTVILDGAIDKLMDFMEKNKKVGICGPRNCSRDMTIQYNCNHFPSIWIDFTLHTRLCAVLPKIKWFNLSQMKYWDYDGIREVDLITGCALMIRNQIYKALGGLDDHFFMYYEETDLCYRMRKLGYSVVYYPDATIIHYGGGSSRNNSPGTVFSKTNMDHFLKSKYYFNNKNYSSVHEIIARVLDLSYGLILLLKNLWRKDLVIRTSRLKMARLYIERACH